MPYDLHTQEVGRMEATKVVRPYHASEEKRRVQNRQAGGNAYTAPN